MGLDESDREVRETVREFMESEVAPDLPEVDAEPISKAEAVEYQRGLGELGVGPGAGEDATVADPVTYTVAVEEIARVWPSLVMVVTMGFPFPVSLVPYAGERTRSALADRARAGELIGCLAVTEPGGGSDNTSPATTARRDGDEYVLDGEKTWVSNATIADVALVLATDAETGERGFFLVDAETTSLASRELHKLGWRGAPTGQLFLDDCRVPVENELTSAVGRMAADGATDILDNPIFARRDPMNGMFAYMRTGMASMAVGIMQAAFEDTLAHVTDREADGEPMAGTQLVQEHLYEMKAGLETGRLLTRHAAAHVGEGHADARLLSSLAKGYATVRAVDVAGAAVRVHGAAGPSSDHPVERYLRDARTTTVPDGTTEIQKLVVGSELTGHAAY